MGLCCRFMDYSLNALKTNFTFCRLYSSKVPKHPHIPHFSNISPNKSTVIDLQTVRYLERLSLVNFGNQEGIKVLESSIKFAENLIHKDTRGVQTLTSVLEKRCCNSNVNN